MTLTLGKPTYRVGPYRGFRTAGRIDAEELNIGGNIDIAGDVTIVGTMAANFTTGATTTTGHLLTDMEVDAGSDMVAAAGESNIDYSLSTGTFLSPTGENTLGGNVTIAGAKTLTTGTGAVSILGDVTVAAHKDIIMGTDGVFTSGTGVTTIAGVLNVSDHLTLAANKNLVMGTAGSGTGTIQTGTGNITLNGNVAQTSTKTFATGTGAVGLNGDVTIAAGKNLTMTTTGAFTSGTGAVALNGDTTIPTAKTLAVTDADKLTVGGVIVPQKLVMNFPISATSVNQWAFIADAAYMLDSIETVFTVTSTSGTLDLYKSTIVQAPGAGATMLTGTIDLAGTANTVVAGVAHGTAGNKSLADGDKMALVFSGTMTGLAGGIVTVVMHRV